MRMSSGHLTGDPSRLSTGRGDFSVQRHRRLHDHERPAGAHPVTIDFVQPLGFLAKTADGHLDARTAQATDAAPADQRVGIAYRYHDASKA